MSTEADAITLEQRNAFVRSLTHALETTYQTWIETQMPIMVAQDISPAVLLAGVGEFAAVALGSVLASGPGPVADPHALLDQWLASLRRATHEVMTDLAQETQG